MPGGTNVAPIELENRNEMLQLTNEDFKKEGTVDTYETFSDKATKAEAILKQKLGDNYTNDILQHIRHVDLSPNEDNPNNKEIGLYYFYDEDGLSKQFPLGFATGAESWSTIISKYLQKDLQKEHTEVVAYVKEINEALKESKNAEFQLEFEVLNTGFVELDRTSGERDLQDLLKKYTTNNNTFDTKKTEKNKAKREVVKTIENNPAIKITKQKINAVQQKREHIEKVLKEQQKSKNNPSDIQKRMRQIADIEIQKNINLTKQLPNILDQRTDALYIDMQDPNKKVSISEENFKQGISDIFTRTQTSGSLAQNIQDDIIDSSAAIEKQFMDTGILPDIFTPTNLKDAKDINQAFQKILRKRVLINIEQKNIDITGTQNNDQITFKAYLDNVMNGSINPATTPFIPSSQYKDAYDNIINANPALKIYLSNNAPNNRNSTNKNSTNITNTSTNNRRGTEITNLENKSEGSINKLNFLQAPIRGLGESMNRNEETIQRAEKVGGLLSIAGTAVLGYKAIQGLYRMIFSDDASKKESGMKRLGAAIAVFGGTYIATGNALDLQKAADKLIDMGKNGINRLGFGEESLKKTVGNLKKVDILLGGLKHETIINYVEKNSDGKMELKIDKYKQGIESGAIEFDDSNQKDKALEELEKVKNDPTFIDAALQTIGITYDYMQNNPNKTLNEGLDGGEQRVINLQLYLETNKLKIAEEDKKKDKVNEFLQDVTLTDPTEISKKLIELEDEGIFIEA